MIKTVLIGWAVVCIQAVAAAADLPLNEFREQYPLRPVRGYTFLGTENSNQNRGAQATGGTGREPGITHGSLGKPCVLPDGTIDGWFNPGEHVAWVADAMKTGRYHFGLVDGYLPAVRYVYRNGGTDATCEMTAFAADAEDQPGAIVIHVALVEKNGSGRDSVRYFKLGGSAPATQAEFDAALADLRRHWESFFANGATIPIPDPEVMNACKASIIRALITYTGNRPHYGVLVYGLSEHDAFPPTTIAMVDCLLDWGQTERACRIMTAYFDDFVGPDGSIRYYGPSVAEYGQLLWVARKCLDAGAGQEWFAHVRPKLEAIRERLWKAQGERPDGLIAGGPEADLAKQVGVYFHNNGWAWRGLQDIAPPLGHADDEPRCRDFRATIQAAVEKATDRSVSPAFIPPMPEKTEFNIMAPFASMTKGVFESYTNYRYWPELLSSGVLTGEQAAAVIAYRKAHGGEIAGMTSFRAWADNWPIAEYAMALMDLGRREEVSFILASHLAGHTTPETWTAYEQVEIKGAPYRSVKADYCVPSQLVAPRLAAWLWGNSKKTAKSYGVRRCTNGSICVDGRQEEKSWEQAESVPAFVLPWEEAADPGTVFRAMIDDDALYFSFDVRDTTLIVAETDGGETMLTKEDRVELYLARDDALANYFCIEIDAGGRVFDYAASHYRNFDTGWAMPGLQVAADRNAEGYTVEGRVPLVEMVKLGLPELGRGEPLRVGLFRADLRPAAGGTLEEHWLSWVDPGSDEPDFHVPDAFGVFLEAGAGR